MNITKINQVLTSRVFIVYTLIAIISAIIVSIISSHFLGKDVTHIISSIAGTTFGIIAAKLAIDKLNKE